MSLFHTIKTSARPSEYDVIENGYKIPFLHIPDSIALDNNKSARDNIKFVTEEVEKLINKGCVSLVTEKPYVVNPLTVANNFKTFSSPVFDYFSHYLTENITLVARPNGKTL
jgi:hypothetical protein